MDPQSDVRDAAMNQTDVQCLFSHKCSIENHAFGFHLQSALEGTGIHLLIDPFHLEDDMEAQIDRYVFDAIILLWSPEVKMSQIVERECLAARRLGLPFFVAVSFGIPPPDFKKEYVWLAPPVESPHFFGAAVNLGRTIHASVGLQRTMRMLSAGSTPDESRAAAERLALDFDRSLLVESLPLLAEQYLQINDPVTRYWIAIALGAAGTAVAADLLAKLPKEDHPLVLEGIRQAREIIKCGT